MTTSISDTPLLTKEEAQGIANKAIELRNAIPSKHSFGCAVPRYPCNCGKLKAWDDLTIYAEHNFESLCHFILESTKA